MDEKLMRHGAFGWFELMTTDVPAAKKFYSDLLGWTTRDMP
jgi:predicted enzyme related to lactoylglutathione lyase